MSQQDYPKSITIELSKETESLIQKALASGSFNSAKHVVQCAPHSTLSKTYMTKPIRNICAVY